MKRSNRVLEDDSGDEENKNVTVNTTKSGGPKYKVNVLNSKTPKNTTGSSNSFTLAGKYYRIHVGIWCQRFDVWYLA